MISAQTSQPEKKSVGVVGTRPPTLGQIKEQESQKSQKTWKVISLKSILYYLSLIYQVLY